MSTLKITQNKIKPAVVASIEEGSIGEELGFEVGDRLISINGVKPRDLIDYKFLMSEENIELKDLLEIYVPIFEARLIGPKKRIKILRIDAIRKKIL